MSFEPDPGNGGNGNGGGGDSGGGDSGGGIGHETVEKGDKPGGETRDN